MFFKYDHIYIKRSVPTTVAKQISITRSTTSFSSIRGARSESCRCLARKNTYHGTQQINNIPQRSIQSLLPQYLSQLYKYCTPVSLHYAFTYNNNYCQHLLVTTFQSSRLIPSPVRPSLSFVVAIVYVLPNYYYDDSAQRISSLVCSTQFTQFRCYCFRNTLALLQQRCNIQ